MLKAYLHILKIKYLVTGLLMMLVGSGVVSAFDLSTYASSSVLASGKWVKISVSESGIHLISVAELRSMGFTDPSKVRIYGYGGARISDNLSSANYVDDLPMVQSVTTSRGIFFYAVGPVSWNRTTDGRFRHTQNPFSEYGYYFVTDNNEAEREIRITGQPGATNPATTFTERLFHERDITSPGETGHLLVGEDFRLTPSQTFQFNLTDRTPGTKARAEIAFVACSKSGTSSISVTANGTALPETSQDKINQTPNGDYFHGVQTISQKEFDIDNDRLTIGINFRSNTLTTLAALNYISVNYTRDLKLNNGRLMFTSTDYRLALEGADQSTRIWDVTNPLDITEINASKSDGRAVWSSSYGSTRSYAAWNENATVLTPKTVGTVTNQDIHSSATPDMVIFTVGNWLQQAERLANLHRNGPDSLKVLVLNQEDVFNEFASGVADVQAFRKCLKMFYDRGEAEGNSLKYALFFGRPTHDNRRMTSSAKTFRYPSMPTWQTDDGLSDNTSYTTDDIFGFLLDNSGNNFANDRLCIAVGRLAVTSPTEAKTVVDKINTYLNASPSGQWKNRAIMVADNADGGVHLDYTEQMTELMQSTGMGSDILYTKIYVDAYDRPGGVSEGARSDMFRALNEGAVWWNYIGHGSPTGLTHEKLLTYTDINGMYFKRWPVMAAMTCDFLRWDQNETSGAEIMMKNPNGGVIGIISATRPTGVTDNGNMARALAPNIFATDGGGVIPVAEAIRISKNSIPGNSNKLRYVYMGDPALRLSVPKNRVVVTNINGVVPGGDTPAEIMASQNAVIEGYIADNSGNIATGFDGLMNTTLYDAEYSVTTKGLPNPNKDDGMESVFDRYGSRLFVGTDMVSNGRFRINIAMPNEISDNYRPGTMQFYASGNGLHEAIGVNHDFYVYGFDEIAVADTVPPCIEEFYLNHSSFRQGGKVNESPVAIARISDDRGINLSLAGIGHQMTMWLDGPSKVYNDVADYFTPSTDGSSSGTIVYPLENLAEGAHTLRLRVWDTAGNPIEQSLEFFVENGMAAQIFDIRSDANPATVEANFYLSHNRPDAMVTVSIDIYDMGGRMVWTSTQSGQSDLFSSFPVKWDLRDMAGRRVGRGIYIYRATMISSDGTVSNSVSKKIAVAAQ